MSPLTASQTAPFGDGTFIVSSDISDGTRGAPGVQTADYLR